MQPDEALYVDLAALAPLLFAHNSDLFQSFSCGISTRPINTAKLSSQARRTLRDCRRLTLDEAEAFLLDRLGTALAKASSSTSHWRLAGLLRDLEQLANSGGPLLSRPAVRDGIKNALAGVPLPAPAAVTTTTPPSPVLSALKVQLADISAKIAALEGTV